MPIDAFRLWRDLLPFSGRLLVTSPLSQIVCQGQVAWLGRGPAIEEADAALIRGPIPVHHQFVFPHGAFLSGEVTPVLDFDASTKDRPVQQRDKTTGEPVWSVAVTNAESRCPRGGQDGLA